MLYDLVKHPARGLGKVIQHITDFAFFRSYQLRQLTQLRDAATRTFGRTELGCKIFNAVKRHVVRGFFPRSTFLRGQAPHSHHLVNQIKTNGVHLGFDLGQLWVGVVFS